MRAVIFDLDGVLVRTDQAHDKAWRALAVRLGIPFDGRAAARLRGVSRMEALDIVLEGCGRSFTPAEKEALAAEKNERYRALTAKLPNFYPLGRLAEYRYYNMDKIISLALELSDKLVEE